VDRQAAFRLLQGRSENEFAMLELAGAPESPSLKTDSSISKHQRIARKAHTVQGKALAVKRFDRLPTGSPFTWRISRKSSALPEPQVQIPQLREYRRRPLAESGENAVWEFVRRLVFSVLIGNADMHLKNWSLLYPDRRTPVLSPATILSPRCLISERHAGFEFRRHPQPLEITPEQMRLLRHSKNSGKPALADRGRDGRAYGHRWKTLEHADLLPKDLRAAIEKQILGVAATTK